jgi:hypothetical protein
MLRPLNLQLQRWRYMYICSRLERFFKPEEIIFVTNFIKIVNFYSAGVVTRGRRIGSSVTINGIVQFWLPVIFGIFGALLKLLGQNFHEITFFLNRIGTKMNQ